MDGVENIQLLYNAQTTLLDHPDKISLIVYTRKCNWSCFGCYNMRDLLREDYVIPYTNKEIVQMLSSPLIDMLIVSGGESLLLKDDLIPTLQYIKTNVNKPIRIDTNGTQYETAKKLVDMKLIDGLAVDVKFPYWLGATSLLYNIVGVDIVDTEDILKTMQLADTLPYSIFRTVKYPILQDSIVNLISSYMKENFKTPHFVNPFYTEARETR